MRTRYSNIGKLYGTYNGPPALRKGEDLSFLPHIEEAFLLEEDGIIVEIGRMADLQGTVDREIDCEGNLVLPAWCDSHTHVVFAESRYQEFRMRLQGKSYEEIAEAGGGILNSAAKLGVASEDDLYLSAAERVKELIYNGVGALEIKSGYGLTPKSEYKMLRVIQRLKSNFPIDIKATFLGAHAIPKAFINNRTGYIDQIINEMIPHVSKEGLADYCDVFCDKGFFTIEESRRILEAAYKYGMKAKIHANELAVSGGVQLACDMNAISCDHLESVTPVEIEYLKQHNTIPTLLPGTSFFLGIPYAPAREMIDSGLGICLASDYNPGSTPSGNIPFLLSLACIRMKLIPEEAIQAVTINGACALELEDTVGALQVGFKSNFIVLDGLRDLSEIMYFYGKSPIKQVVIGTNVF